MPEPLAIVDHLDGLSEEAPDFIPTAELADVLDFEPAWLGRRLAELGYQSTRERVTEESGKVRQIRGYLTADLLAAVSATRDGELRQESADVVTWTSLCRLAVTTAVTADSWV